MNKDFYINKNSEIGTKLNENYETVKEILFKKKIYNYDETDIRKRGVQMLTFRTNNSRMAKYLKLYFADTPKVYFVEVLTTDYSVRVHRIGEKVTIYYVA